MKTELVDIESQGALKRAADLLKEGEPICFPTDTVYGIGADAFQPEAVTRLYQLKGRPVHLPIPLLLSDASVLSTVCIDIPPVAWQLAASFWPGGLSLVLYRATSVPDVVTSGGATVAVRVPDHDQVRELCRHLGAPLAATSANSHGQTPSVEAGSVWNAFRGRIPLILDGGTCPGGMASTVLDLSVAPPVILRHGPVSAWELAESGVLGND